MYQRVRVEEGNGYEGCDIKNIRDILDGRIIRSGWRGNINKRTLVKILEGWYGR